MILTHLNKISLFLKCRYPIMVLAAVLFLIDSVMNVSFSRLEFPWHTVFSVLPCLHIYSIHRISCISIWIFLYAILFSSMLVHLYFAVDIISVSSHMDISFLPCFFHLTMLLHLYVPVDRISCIAIWIFFFISCLQKSK